MQVAKLRYKLYTNVSDFTGDRTVPSMDNSNAARVPSPPLLLYRIVKYEYSYCKVLYLPYYRIEPTTVPTVQYCGFHYLLPTSTTYNLLPNTSCLLPTTYYLLPAIPNNTYYLLPATCYLLPTTYYTYYLLPTTYCLLPTCYLLPTAYYLLPATCYLLPTTYYLLPTTIPAIPTYYLLYLLPTTCYLLHSVLLYLLPPTYYLLPTVLPSSFNQLQQTDEDSN